MSGDTVDDLHAAEDFGEALRVKARRVVEAWGGVIGNADGSSRQATALGTLGTLIRELGVASAEQFERPGCEADNDAQPDEGDPVPCIQGEDCGGYHSWQEEDDG